MIQRIQSLLLLIVSLSSIALIFSPILAFEYNNSAYLMTAYESINISTTELMVNNMGIGVLAGLVAVLSLVIIFMYKRRHLQVKLCGLNILLIALNIAAMVFYSDAVRLAITDLPDKVEVALNFGAFIPLIQLILTYLAIRFIKKDEALVRAADRIR